MMGERIRADVEAMHGYVHLLQANVKARQREAGELHARLLARRSRLVQLADRHSRSVTDELSPEAGPQEPATPGGP